MCDENSQIQKIYTLDHDFKKFLLLFITNIFTCFLINLFLVWYPRLKLFLIYSKVSIEKAKYVCIYGRGI